MALGLPHSKKYHRIFIGRAIWQLSLERWNRYEEVKFIANWELTEPNQSKSLKLLKLYVKIMRKNAHGIQWFWWIAGSRRNSDRELAQNSFRTFQGRVPGVQKDIFSRFIWTLNVEKCWGHSWRTVCSGQSLKSSFIHWKHRTRATNQFSVCNFWLFKKKINPGKQTLKQVLSNEMSELETRVKKFYKIL